ncbi:O-antigen ligase family protein [Azospirillum sp. B506]|uniref:O-antigen ligase family protein n=1 Tax=Azospirillum sp. B506 TaxID=137721 RepID=UPI00034DB641|nr:O-antigen ligase family protein [Azospirillum sp. B506]
MTAAGGKLWTPGLGILICLAVGLPIGMDITLVGRLTGTEIVLIPLMALRLMTGSLPPIEGPVRTLLILTLVWCGAQYVSDIVNDSSTANMLRGVARALMTALLILGFLICCDNRMRNIHVLYVAMGLGLMAGAYVNPSTYTEAEPWKFGYGTGASMLLVAGASWLWRQRLHLPALALCSGIGVLNLELGFRSMGGMVFMTAILLGLSRVLGTRRRILSAWGAALRIAVTLLVLSGGSVLIIDLYASAAQQGLLGQEEQEKFANQVDDRGVLLSGRAELPISIEAVKEKPLLGHGSWAEDEYYSTLYWQMSGLQVDDMMLEERDLIPTHSHLMGAWVEGGILSALFWFYVLFLLARTILALVHNRSLADPIVILTLIMLGWAVPFSPYGLSNRVMSSFAIAVAATMLRLDSAQGSPGPASAHRTRQGSGR